MMIAADIGQMELAVGGMAAALARLMEPVEGEAQEALAAHVIAALQQAASRPLDRRRLMMTARLAETQALVLTLRTFRKVEEARRDIDGLGEGDPDLDWLHCAERSLEASVQGETFMATNPPGLSLGWLDVAIGRPWPGEPRRILDYRQRAEAVAIVDLELALAPEPIPERLLHHMICGACSLGAGWFDAFSVFLGWQIHTKPHLIEPMLGIDPARMSKQMRARLAATFETAQHLAANLERGLVETSSASLAPARCAALSQAGGMDGMVRAVSAALGAPEAPLAAIGQRLTRGRLAPARLGRALRQHAALLAGVHDRWRRPDWSALAPAHEALCDGRLADAARWMHANIADSASGLSERADVEVLAGRYLQASDLYGRALEGTDPSAARDRLSLQLRLAEAMTFEHLASGAAEAKSIAMLAAEAALEGAAASGPPAARLRAASVVAELALAPKGPERGSTLVSAIATLDAALSGDAGISLDRIEAEGQRVDYLVELGTIDKDGRQRHQDTLANSAKALASVDMTAAPDWLRDMASGTVARGLIGAPEAAVGDAAARQAQGALEPALSGDLSTIDPHLAGVLLRRLGEAHQKLAKGGEARARQEAAAISFVRGLRFAESADDRVAVLQQLRDTLERLAKGEKAEWRLCQALAALNAAEMACERDKPTVPLVGVFRQRAIVWTRLRKLSRRPEDLSSAVADADAAQDLARKIKSPWWIHQALRAKANALLEAGTDERRLDLVVEAETVLSGIIADAKALKINDRDLCHLLISQAEAAELRGVLAAEPAALAAGCAAARDAYRKALALATRHNLPAKGKCEAALKKLEAEAA